MRFSRSFPDRFKAVFMKDLPSVVQDKIKTLSRFLEISEGAVMHALITDWVAKEAAEISIFGKRTTTNVYPFQFDNSTNIVLGEGLFRLLKAEHIKEMILDEASSKTHEQYLKKVREEIQESKEDIEEKIGLLLKWTYENTNLARTPATDRSLSYVAVLYLRAGFSEDQLKELLAEEAEYLKKKDRQESRNENG